MSRLIRNTLHCLIWLLLSHIMCLVLAFSFAILPKNAMRYLGLLCCLITQVLLMGNCAVNIAKEHLALYRTERIIVPKWEPAVMSLLTALPALILYSLLWLMPDSVPYFNIYLLLNAPTVQIINLIVQGKETFGSLSAMQRLLMALLPLIPTLATLGGYLIHYPKHLAEEIAIREK
ncbi:MAG: hypothetical protein PUC41_09275 [Oscillospiraceae bacterium]|nr:hypothetical protein [Oscillospiraceae bacterium]